MLPRISGRICILAMVAMCLCPTYALSYEAEQFQCLEKLTPFEAKPYQMMEDDGPDPRWYDCALQYYYYVPCPTYSWFWAYYGWEPGDIIGACFRIGDQGTGGFDPCDPYLYHNLEWIRILDFAGYGTIYPGLFTIKMDVYCSDETPNPLSHLWSSGPLETHLGWNYFEIDPPLIVTQCCEQEGPPPVYPTIVVTMTMIGVQGLYPQVGFDNISTAVDVGCLMHEYGCMPAVYPRAWAGPGDPGVHSGYVGRYPFEHWPPLPFPDGIHTDPHGSEWYGFVEVAWRVYLSGGGP